MTTLMTASHQWATRPSDERFTSLDAMQVHFDNIRNNSRAKVVSSRGIEFHPTDDLKGLTIIGRDLEQSHAPTHFAFGQLAQLAKAPAGYLRTLMDASPLVADQLNYLFKYKRDVEDVGVLSYQNGDTILRAATGPNYGRIWNADIVKNLRDRFGNGVDGHWRVPGEFGKRVTVTKDNTTLYAGDRDMFVFLADEENRIDVPNRRDGATGSMARGFFVWNSEVGSSTFGVSTFLFDYVCCNRIVWGAADVKTITIRHTAGAPDKFLDEIRPALESYAKSSTTSITAAIEDARKDRLSDVGEFLKTRFGAKSVDSLQRVHMLEEGRPIETRWDVVTAVTARAKSVTWQDERVAMEREAGKLLAA